MEYINTALLIYIACNLYYIAYCINIIINKEEHKDKRKRR